ncbi:MAG TPA: phosphate acyltransferase [Anaerovoracaceae bacterium]|nr:phosphate acyltransferase [Anaerovoracaceae bacterium]
MRTFEDMIALMKGASEKKTVVVAGADDEHTLEGLHPTMKAGLIKAVLIGNRDKINEIIKRQGYEIDAPIIHVDDEQKAAEKAVFLIREGKGDFLMKGKLQTATLLKEVVNKENGLNLGGVMSHVGLFEIPTYHKLVAITDGGMVLNPDLTQKKSIIENAVRALKGIGIDTPKVAVMAGAEVVNPKATESVDADALKKMYLMGEIKDCIVEGPISYDLAMSREAAEMKGYASPVAGDADVMIMPNMAAGNLVAKSLTVSGNAKMAGIIMGAKVPIVLVSRSASSEEKFLSLLFAAAVSR